MARLVTYRAKLPELVKQRMEETLQTTMYLVQTTGPTSYVIQEQNCAKKHRVLIGSLQTCSCKDAEICVHILFVMLKILRVPATTPIVWQKSLIDSEIEMLLRGDYRDQQGRITAPKHACTFLKKRREAAAAVPETNDEDADVEQHPLVEGEVCAICQEDMDNNQPLTFCRKGCGNSFHIECMKVFGESRKQSKENIICPLCRHDWGELALTALKKEIEVANRAPNVHKNVSCKKCQVKPIRNQRYRCVQCKNTDLCERCFKSNVHLNHSFVMKTNTKDPWIPALREIHRRPAISSEMISELESRELSTNDYDVLLQLDQGEKFPVQEYLLSILGGQKVAAQNAKTFGDPGGICVICRHSLRIQADIRSLLCGHIFHDSCLSRSILSQMYSCPHPECEHVLFPGLHYLNVKEKKQIVGRSEETNTPQDPSHSSHLPQLGQSFSILPLQQRVGSSEERRSSCTNEYTKELSQHRKFLSSKVVQSVRENLPPVFGLESKGLVPSVRTTSDPIASSCQESKIKYSSRDPQTSIEDQQNTGSSRSRVPPSRPLMTVADSRQSKSAFGDVQMNGLPPLFTRENLVNRMDVAEQTRVEIKLAQKQRLRKQREQREERVRLHLANNGLSELSGILCNMSKPQREPMCLDQKKGKGHESSKRVQHARITTQRNQEDQQLHSADGLESLFIGVMK